MTRHNTGFLFLDYFAGKYGLSYNYSHPFYYSAAGKFHEFDFILVKPTTFVNRSGLAAREFIGEFLSELESFLVICDDINLSLGDFRIRRSGGDGGHNGLKSIIDIIGSDEFPRLRIGVHNKTDVGDLSEFVLENFSDEELAVIKNSFEDITVLVEEFIIGGVSKMLNRNSQLKNPPSH